MNRKQKKIFLAISLIGLFLTLTFAFTIIVSSNSVIADETIDRFKNSSFLEQ